MTGREIEINFRSDVQRAEELEAVAENLERLSKNKYKDTMQQISANWRGECASLYLQKGDVLQEELLEVATELKKIAETTRNIAKRTYLAEKKALEIAQRRENK